MADIFTNNTIGFNSPQFGLSVSMGRIPGFDVVDKFGLNTLIEPSTDPEDIWEQGGTYEFTADTGATYYMSSSDVSDTQPVRMGVLTVDSNGNWNDETVVQSLNGQTPVEIVAPSGDPVVRFYRAENISTRGDDFVGSIYFYETDTVTGGVPDSGSTTIRGLILNGNNQTQMAIYTVPTGKVGFLFEGELGLEFDGSAGAGTQFARCEYRSARQGEVFKTKKTISLTNIGTNIYQNPRFFRDPIPAKTDIKFTVKEVSDAVGIWGTFCILLVDEKYISSNRLAEIGQELTVR